ncbi:MAG: hypothetical protein LBC96_10110 [Lachnospiraceae bacterium]|jgi:hypothetical protein|nr:hypothetical protein [Lachnospiraceae bacterium]
MKAIFKFFNSVLGILAVVVCLAAVGVIVYAVVQPDISGVIDLFAKEEEDVPSAPLPEPPPPNGNDPSPPQIHYHLYNEEEDLAATCVTAGRMLGICECGDFYYEEIEATGHSPGEWQLILAPTETSQGVRIMVCVVCAETVAREVLPATAPLVPDPPPNPNPSPPDPTDPPEPPPPPHVHDYTSAVTVEPSCVVAGIRRFTCDCGSFYQENIPAIGHMAADWVVVREATTTRTGVRQRLCNVCHILIDSQQIPRLPVNDPDVVPPPPPPPHEHSFKFYVYLAPTCITVGISTGDCSICGAEESRPIPLDRNNHSFNSRGICTRCGFVRPTETNTNTN